MNILHTRIYKNIFRVIIYFIFSLILGLVLNYQALATGHVITPTYQSATSGLNGPSANSTVGPNTPGTIQPQTDSTHNDTTGTSYLETTPSKPGDTINSPINKP